MNGGDSSNEIQNIVLNLDILEKKYQAAEGNDTAINMVDDDIKNYAFKLTTDILKKMGGSDDTSRYYSATMYKLILLFVDKKVKGNPFSEADRLYIIGLIEEIGTTYSGAKVLTMLERAEIPVISAIVGIIRTSTNVCSSIEEFNKILKGLDKNAPQFPEYGCPIVKRVTSYGSAVASTVAHTVTGAAKGIYTNVSNIIRPSPPPYPVNGGGSVGRKWTKYLNKYKKKQKRIKKTKKYNKKRNKYYTRSKLYY